MFKPSLGRALLLAAAALGAAPGRAQPAPPPDPAAAGAPVPPVRYTSALAGYRAFSDTPKTPWRQANDAVAGIGGWRAYAREAQLPTPAAPGASATPGAHPSHRSAP